MAFVKNNFGINSWLSQSPKSFALLDDCEYKKVLKKWRNEFEFILEKKEYVCKGEKAMLTIEDSLPIEAFIFNFPGYKNLPASTNSRDRAYAYHVESLLKVDRELFNESDCIVCDVNFQYTCIYTHEWQAMALPVFYQSK